MSDQIADEGRMTLVEHLTELRNASSGARSSWSSFTVVVFVFYNPILHFFSAPYEDVTKGKTERRRAARTTPTTGCKLIATGPLEPFLVRLKVSTYGGIALAVPFVFWQIWRFVTPGLHKNERRYGISFLIAIVRAVRRWAASWPGSRSRRRSSSCWGSGAPRSSHSSPPTST